MNININVTRPRLEILQELRKELQEIKDQLAMIEKKIELGINEECSICFENIDQNDQFFLKCKHSYHTTCIGIRLSLRDSCPVCRQST